jgi:hypothetical protein
MRGCRSILAVLLLSVSAPIVLAQLPPWVLKVLSGETEWSFTDPAYLYLTFKIKGVPAESTTWLHPMVVGSCPTAVMESFLPGHQQEAKAFSYQISRQTLQGYEVTFQPVDPMPMTYFEVRPLPERAIKVFFPRSGRSLFKLTDKIEVVGFYGDPAMKVP